MSAVVPMDRTQFATQTLSVSVKSVSRLLHRAVVSMSHVVKWVTLALTKVSAATPQTASASLASVSVAVCATLERVAQIQTAVMKTSVSPARAKTDVHVMKIKTVRARSRVNRLRLDSGVLIAEVNSDARALKLRHVMMTLCVSRTHVSR